MDIVFNEVGQEFKTVLQTIHDHPQAWRSWFCLNIQTSHIERFSLGPEDTKAIENLLDVVLEEYEGKLFYCDEQNLYLIIKMYSKAALYDLGQEIISLLNLSDVELKVMDLETELIDITRSVISSVSFDSSNPDYDQSKVKQNNLLCDRLASEILERKVLLIEDDPSTRWLVRTALKKHCHVSTAPNVEVGTQRILSIQPDLIFLDIGLPDEEGFSILHWMQQYSPETDIVMFSGENNIDNISKALEAGAKGFISKPFDKGDLLHYVQAIKI